MSTTPEKPSPQTTGNCFLTTNTASAQVLNNPFSKTTTSPTSGGSVAVIQQPVTTTSGQSSTPVATTTPNSGGGAPETPASDRQSVILAPARLALNTFNTNTNNGLNQTQNNYFNSFGQNSAPILAESRLSTTTGSLLRPSVLRLADSSTNNTQNAQKDGKTFAFVSLSKEDITRPATTLLQSDSVIRCGADTTSPFNGDEAPHSGQSGAGAVTSTSSGGDVGATSDGDDSNSQSAFVFGQNLEERAVFKHKINEIAENSDTNSKKKLKTDDKATDDSTTGADSACASTSGEQTVIKTTSDGALDLSSTGSADNSPEKANSGSRDDNKRKYEVITGEEDEQNVLSMHCRLYAWETDTWKERGRGCLRLNDAIKDEKLCSRIVMRTSGALRVILNAHLVSGMRFDMSNDHCLRFINVDGIYIIKGNPKDIDQLNSAIDYRLREISKRHKSDSESEEESSPKVSADITQKSIEDLSNDS